MLTVWKSRVHGTFFFKKKSSGDEMEEGSLSLSLSVKKIHKITISFIKANIANY